ncbi:inositol monophosphatase family protein [Mariprofundus ferrooxydans]|nr:inositol monophosphatase family protein [Mariprofundus ferrooxydans]
MNKAPHHSNSDQRTDIKRAAIKRTDIKQANITLQSLASILQQAGQEIILPAFQRSIQSCKKADGSFVTETDLACQRFIESELFKLDGSIAFLGEEMNEAEQLQCLDNNSYWCLDPLDGTTNFIASFPGFAISLALIQAGQAQLACIYDPVRHEMFTAERDAGVWLNQQPITCSKQNQLNDAIGFVDFKRLNRHTAISLACDRSYRSQRNIGSCALEWAWLAAGRGDFIIHGSEKIWDFAAGSLIAQTAGACVGDFTGQALFPCQKLSSPILATCSPSIQEKLQVQLANNR